MKKFWVIYFVGVLLLSTRIWAAAWNEPVALSTPEEKAEAFLKIRTLIPSITDGAVRNGVNMNTLFDNNSKILDLMANDPKYQELLPAHRDLVEFSILSDAPVAASDEKSEAWKAQVARATLVAKDYGLENNPSELAARIRELISSNLLGKTQGIAVGIAQILGGEIKKEFFSASVERKLEIMKSALPQEIVQAGFAPAKVGWTDTTISKEEIIKRFQSAAQADKLMTAFLTYHYSIMQKNFSSPKDYISGWSMEPHSKKVLEQAFNTLAKQLPSESKAPVAEPSLVLREVGPLAGLFRGYAGNDCSTLCSFPYSHSPNEYVFIVYDKKGAVKGYAQGTKVVIGGKESFYLHTIAGPRISSEDALDILKLFEQEKGRMGFAHIALPKKSHLTDMVNFVHVRDVMISVMTPEQVRLDYQDSKMREDFKSKFSLYKSYDVASANEYGHIVDSKKLGSVISVLHKLSPSFATLNTQITKEELFGILLQLSKDGGNTQNLREALIAKAGLDLKEVQLLMLIAENSAKKPAFEFLDGFEKSMQEKGYQYPNGYFRKNIAMLVRGLLRSPDLLTNPKLLEETVRSLVDQREMPRLTDFFMSNQSLFANDKLAELYLTKYLGDVHEAQLSDPRALEAALNKNPKVVLFSEQIMDSAMRSPRSAEKIFKFIDANSNWAFRLQARNTGKNVLARKHAELMALSEIRKEMLQAPDERIYMLAMTGGLTEKFNSDQQYDLIRRYKRILLSTTMDYYVTLNPKDTAKDVKLLFSQDTPEDSRVLRRLAPVLMQTTSFWDLEANIKALAKIQLQTPSKSLGQMIYKGLSERKGIENMELERIKDLEVFPEIKWESLRVPQCRKVLLSM
jgi:hypothetical protein